MGITVRERRWGEIVPVGQAASVEVQFETVDLGDGSPLVEAIRFRTPRDRDLSVGGYGDVMFSLRDLEALVDLAKRYPENLGG